jgi:YD repeat-containing protein
MTPDFPVGRLTAVQEVSRLGVAKTTAGLQYFPSTDPVNSGRLMEIDTPKPGTVGGNTVKTTYTYDALGNVMTLTQPGISDTNYITTTFQYITDMNADGSTFIQPNSLPKIGEPLSVTDAAGKVTHFRYSVRGDLISARDALNSAASAFYNVAGQPAVIALPPTDERGCATDTTVLTYQYPGGPLIKSQLYDETGTGMPVRTVNYGYGNEGEFLSRSGDTEAVTQTYDPMMRLSTVKDGKNQMTVFTYQAAGSPGYLQSIQYPAGDTVQFPSYDGDGRPTERIDGNGVVTNYNYSADPMQTNDAGQLYQIT